MKAFITTIAIAAVFGLPLFCAAADPGPSAVSAVSSAPTPSAAVEAYARASAAQANSIPLQEAYVKRMVDFSMPQMAAAQAAALNQTDPAFAIAWAVSALEASRQQQTALTMTDVAVAHRLLPDDPFVRRTAGQLMAWYDTLADRTHVPQSVQQDVAALKATLAADPIYADAYAQTRGSYSQISASASAATLNAQAGLTLPQTPPVADYGAMPTGSYVNGYVSPAPPPAVAYDYYAQPYVAAPAYSPAYDPGYYNPGPYFYAPSVIVTPGFGGFGHARFFHDGGFRGGGFHGGFAHSGGFHGGGGHHR